MGEAERGRLRVCLLGTVRAWRGATALPLGPPQQRAVLAVLALAAGQPVSRDELVNVLWPEAPPARASNVIQTHVKHLRQALEPDRPARAASAVLPAVGSGYALRVDPSTVDALRFRRLVGEVREARRADDAERVWRVARAAIDLWGTPVADVAVLATHPRVAALVAEWQLLLGWYAEVATAQGRADEVVALLEEQARARPLDEPVQVALLRAYGALGRRADAFAVYAEARKRLALELGVDAGQALVTAYEELLHDEAAPAGVPAPPAAPPVPAQLPADVHDFVGREPELADLDRDAAPAGLAVIVGPPGVGKTALGLRWAHRASGRFPDGQLHVDLRGFGGDEPLRPAVVLERFLRAFEVVPPPGSAAVDELAARLRTHLAGRRVLLFLDNAASADQVHPLLPGRGGSVAVVTSRRRLDGLVALHGAARVTLGPLPRADAVTLMARLSAPAPAGALADLAELCDRLPLALRIAGSRLDPRAGFGVSDLAHAMVDERTRLDQLATDAGEISVRAVFATSMRALDPAAQRLLRLLGSHPGPRPSLAACAALAGLPERMTRAVAGRLVAAHLLVPAGPGHVVMHDLVRLIAREESLRVDRAAEREEAVRRLLAWYRDTADSADSRLRPGERPNFGTPARSDLFADEAAAFAWLDAEAPNLVAAVEQAAHAYPREAWQVAAAMFGWLHRRHNRAQWVALYTTAADAAARAGDRGGEAMIVGRLAMAHGYLGRTAEAVAACERAFRIRSAMGDHLGAATALLNLGAVYLNHDEPEPAIAWFQRAAAELGAEAARKAHFSMILHSNLGEAHRLTGRFAASAHHLGLALQAGLASGAVRDSAQILVELGRLCLDRDDPADALTHAHRALDNAVQTGDAMVRAEATECIGRALLAQGDVVAGRAALAEALAGYERIGHRNTAKLRELTAGARQLPCRRDHR